MELEQAVEPFVIITPAHNEEALIERTIQSMIAQTVRPLKWILVNDGSTDRTADIIKSYAVQHRFISLIDVEREKGRNFAKKVAAFNRGLEEVRNRDYQYIGNLDADICLEPYYYEEILSEFKKDSMLGIAGGIVFTYIHGDFVTLDATLDSVGGAVQLFRRACLEAVGGYIPLQYGGIDAAAEIKAKKLGWKVRKFPVHKVFEQRRTGSVQTCPMRAKIREGRRFYSLGYSLIFYIARCIYRIKDPPFLIGSIAALSGFIESLIIRRPIQVTPDVVAYLRAEQFKRLKRIAATSLQKNKN